MSEIRLPARAREESHAAGVTAEEGQKILTALKGLRYGSVEVVVHDGRVVQIERKEKVRLDR